ncbi:MAG: DUF996 domain-containing protein [Gammaproteobacteria bacterium]|nr:DUF996 domain-containing protein [Gammaproteobacteria bacterium]
MEQSTKMLGGIAYIVMIVFSIFGTFLPFLGIINLIAAICVLVAFIQAGNQVGRPDVKNNIIIAIVLYIVAAILLMFIVGAGLAAMFAAGDAETASEAASGLAAFGTGALIGGIIAWILAIIGAWFWYKASSALTEATGEGLFKVGGLLLFIGAILLVVFGIGGIVMLVGEILQAIAFFKVPEKGMVKADNAT